MTQTIDPRKSATIARLGAPEPDVGKPLEAAMLCDAGKSERCPVQNRKARLLELEETARNPLQADAEPGETFGDMPEADEAALVEALAWVGLDYYALPKPPSPRATCGALTRKRAACIALALPNGRCRNHGGMSTGPLTAAGWARSRAGYQRWLDGKRDQNEAQP